jgi:thiol-disulfide isomerase/thioredoxin
MLPLLVPGARTAASEPTAIAWQADLARAQAEAKSRNCLVWLQFTGPWCHYCVRMEREVFQDQNVIEQAGEQFIAVKLRSDVHEQLAVGYGLTSLPATVILKPSGEVVAKREGFADAAEFRTFLGDAHAHAGLVRRPAPIASVNSAKEDRLAMAGYCPVSLVEHRQLVAGREGVTLTHEGRVYRFLTDSGLRLFQRRPKQYIPLNGGRCPVAEVDRGESREGDPRCGVLYKGHLYLCGDPTSQKRFLRSPERYAHVDRADRGFCVHCWGRDRLLARGRSRDSLFREGRQLLFPSVDALTALRTSSDSTRR